MTDSVATFFDAWEIAEFESRLNQLACALAENIEYSDPRTPEPLSGIAAVNDYVGMFSANAPGWSAKVMKNYTVDGITRVTVAFGGMGPDGKEQIQLGQYFIEKDGHLITRMVGFVGTGE